MVCLGNLTLSKGKKFEECYKSPKSVSKLSEREIRDYIATYGWMNDNENFDFETPLIVSPIDKPKTGLEFKSGYTGDVKYSGIVDHMYKKFSRKEAEGYVSSERARFENRQINIDTYYNKVIYEAWKRGIIKFYHEGPNLFFSDLVNLRFNASMKRNSVQNSRLQRELQGIMVFEKASKRSIKEDKRPICAAVV